MSIDFEVEKNYVRQKGDGKRKFIISHFMNTSVHLIISKVLDMVDNQ